MNADQQTVTEYTRLHVTPLRPDLLSVYLGPALASAARNVSYHTVETFPEVGFGYLELPAMDANKIKTKLNGAILKGKKIRVEDARLEKRQWAPLDRTDGQEGAGNTEQPNKKTRRSKKSKAGEKVLQGFVLGSDRKVVRGWTEPTVDKKSHKEARGKDKTKGEQRTKKDKKQKREVSKYTNEQECLFRTKMTTTAESVADLDPKSRKEKKKKKDRGVVIVHEFENTKKHASFLKSAKPPSEGETTQEYIEGTGWVDKDGRVLEVESDRQKEHSERKERRERRQMEKEQTKLKQQQHSQQEQQDASDPSSSEPSSSEPSSPEPSSKESSSSSDIDDEVTAPDTPKAVHPLEALYKRPKLSSLDTTPQQKSHETAFTFFGGADDSDIEQEEELIALNEPQTPFTTQDMAWREVRSAAPTPDTAAIGRRFSFSVMTHINEDDDDDDQDGIEENEGKMDVDSAEGAPLTGLGITNSVNPRETGIEEESEFARWFFENRGDNNRKWRARRREAMKTKRKRENRRLTRRIV